jgi:hypothetical protein
MAQDSTLVLRVELEQERSIYRDIEVDGSKSLYKLGEAIVKAFGFDFDHAFGFYSGHNPRTMFDKRPRYELFADMGEDPDPGVLGVKKTKLAEAFPSVGHKMLFLFDYGDEWLFRVTFKEAGSKVAKTRYPRVVASQGEAPAQYPEADEDDGPVWGYNLTTGEKILLSK